MRNKLTLTGRADKLFPGIREVTNTALTDTTCKLDFTLSRLFGSVKEMIWKLSPNVYGTFENSFGFTVMQSVCK